MLLRYLNFAFRLMPISRLTTYMLTGLVPSMNRWCSTSGLESPLACAGLRTGSERQYLSIASLVRAMLHVKNQRAQLPA